MSKSSVKELSDSFNKMNTDDLLLVCAIDFGTTFSGYAFSFASDKTKISMYKDWGSCMGVALAHRTPTCCLTTSDDGKFVAFGYDAQEAFMNMEQDDVEGYSYYDKFKMYLHRTKNLSRRTYIAARYGVNVAAIRVFSMGLRHLATHMLQQVEKQTSKAPTKDQIRWVITVPAIWSDASKQFMREAAKEADIIDKVDSHNLVIALEPEAASLYCRQLHVNHPGSTEPRLPPGTNYLVMDCGGGTLDVTVHHLRGEDEVAELYQATGSDLGGTKVDANFVQLLKDVFGEDVIDDYLRSSPADSLTLLTNFEQKKKVVSPEKVQMTNLMLGMHFIEVCQEVAGCKLTDLISDEWKEKGMKITNGQLKIPHSAMLGLFEPVVRGIIEHMKTLMSVPEVKDVTHLLLIGGFAESPVLQHAVRKEFANQMSIIIPDEASLCVMKGATLFGHNPSSIVSRRAKKTYGTDVYPEFVAGKHDPTKTKMYGKTRRAEGVFRIWVKKGDEIGQPIKTTHLPVTGDQSNISIGIYSSQDKHPEYCKDPGVELLGNITVDLPGTGLDRRVEVTLSFGGTELCVEGRDCRPGGASAKTTINFLAD